MPELMRSGGGTKQVHAVQPANCSHAKQFAIAFTSSCSKPARHGRWSTYYIITRLYIKQVLPDGSQGCSLLAGLFVRCLKQTICTSQETTGNDNPYYLHSNVQLLLMQTLQDALYTGERQAPALLLSNETAHQAGCKTDVTQ